MTKQLDLFNDDGSYVSYKIPESLIAHYNAFRDAPGRYYVTTYDWDKQEYTPQKGVRTGPYTKFGLRKALRKLRTMGYCADRDDTSVLVEKRLIGE